MLRPYRLYHYPLSPFCRKLRLVLAEKRIRFDLIEERYWEQRSGFLRLNPAGKVPVLTRKGEILTDSQAISEYFDTLIPDPPLVPEDPADQYEMRRLVNWFDEKFYQEVTCRLIFERILRRTQEKGPPDAHNLRLGIQRLKFHLEYLDFLLTDRSWLAGSRVSLADFTIAAHLSCVDYTNDIDWSYSLRVNEWYSILKSRPAFQPILADFLPEFPPPNHYADLDFE